MKTLEIILWVVGLPLRLVAATMLLIVMGAARPSETKEWWRLAGLMIVGKEPKE